MTLRQMCSVYWGPVLLSACVMDVGIIDPYRGDTGIAGDTALEIDTGFEAVSYTHLTLPTNREV